MIVNLLCPGPSLTQRFHKGIAGPRIGVNRAVVAFDCDYWAFGDPEVYRAVVPLGWPVLFVGDHAITGLQYEIASQRKLTHEALRPYGPPIGWETFTACAALVLALHIGAKEVHCYGCDWAGDKDFDGARPSAYRNAERWGRESSLWNRMVAFLANRNVSVNRIP